MDLFLAICEGLGLALATGIFVGAALPARAPAGLRMLFAIPLAAVAAGIALQLADETVLPALVLGFVVGGLGAHVSSELVAGATRREEGAASGVVAFVVLFAAVLAAASLLLPPVSLAALAAVFWLAVSRGRREQRKHEGLRVLR